MQMTCNVYDTIGPIHEGVLRFLEFDDSRLSKVWRNILPLPNFHSFRDLYLCIAREIERSLFPTEKEKKLDILKDDLKELIGMTKDLQIQDRVEVTK
jgi:hypothetical protein